jgi:hypothetical protein
METQRQTTDIGSKMQALQGRKITGLWGIEPGKGDGGKRARPSKKFKYAF